MSSDVGGLVLPDRRDWLTLLGEVCTRFNFRRPVFLGKGDFVERFAQKSQSLDQLRELPRVQRRPLAQPLRHFEYAYPLQPDAMARAFRTGVYTLQEIADHFRVRYSTVSRAVQWLEANEREMQAWKTVNRRM
ncbi:putative uncharacterized protein [Methylocaldum marinum]|uniref:Uncharacterized protein n=1 Tax=Methylocaldum marinum TaxID=1432792 RepID=A0A250KMT2_9GAMM|nr:hypothetical protein [Methylocaldum marinum]BBA32877.1 putative uncharacterized protein [Methylocaldum marinum]